MSFFKSPRIMLQFPVCCLVLLRVHVKPQRSKAMRIVVQRFPQILRTNATKKLSKSAKTIKVGMLATPSTSARIQVAIVASLRAIAGSQESVHKSKVLRKSYQEGSIHAWLNFSLLKQIKPPSPPACLIPHKKSFIIARIRLCDEHFVSIKRRVISLIIHRSCRFSWQMLWVVTSEKISFEQQRIWILRKRWIWPRLSLKPATVRTLSADNSLDTSCESGVSTASKFAHYQRF